MIIATRKLKVHTGEQDIDVEVRLFNPVNDRGAWICNYEIEWPTGTKKSLGAGADAIQAILLTLQKIGIEIYTSPYHENGELSWFSPGKGYGFPVSSNVRDLLIGDDKML